MPQNVGLRQSALDLIESIRETVHQECGAIVSCADISNLATKHAVMQSGVPGNLVPGYLLPLGRKDSLGPATTQQVRAIPSPDLDVNQLVEAFASRGLNEVDLVALSGAHTIGKASCGSFMNRDGENDEFVQRLKNNCTYFPVAPLQDLDVTTPNTFDNYYYKNLQNRTGVLHSDMQLTLNATINQLVDFFAADRGWFFSTFSTSMSNLAHLEGKPAIIGEVRRNCFKVNGLELTAPNTFVASA
jgi:peroxidase